MERRDVLAASLQRGGQSVDADLGVPEDEQPIEAVVLVQLDERGDLVLLGDEVDELADRLDRAQVRPHGDVRRVRAS